MADKKECIYSVSGMHCASCEILIERKMLEMGGVKSVDASTAKCQVLIEYEGSAPSVERLNKTFAADNYIFSDKYEAAAQVINLDNIIKTLGLALLVIFGFFVLKQLGLGQFANVSASSSLPSFFVLGLVAGASSCAALVGGIVLSMSKQWLELYAGESRTTKKMQPHVMFNIGRILSYSAAGAFLGAAGKTFQVSLKFSSFLVIAVSVLMICLGLQMLGVRAFRRFQFAAPKFMTRYIANEKNFTGKYMPAILGGLTVFLPCGFTITTEGIALLSGNAWQGAAIMLVFALGTAPALLTIGASSVKFGSRPHFASQFSKVAGLIVIFFALYNLNAQMNVLGFTGFGNLFSHSGTAQNNGLPPIVDGKQILKMEASSRGYSPNYLRVRAGVPVRWEITDTGTSGCTNAVISKLFDGQIDLTPGTTSVKEFTPNTVGKFRFSCWMGMITGIIEVIDPNKASVIPAANAAGLTDAGDVVPSGAHGCGCGRGSTGSCHVNK